MASYHDARMQKRDVEEGKKGLALLIAALTNQIPPRHVD